MSDWVEWRYNPNLVPFNLKVIGVYPEDFFNHRIAVRSDCGAFWWAIAQLKYRYILATNTLHSLVLRILFRSGMLRVKPYEKPTLKDFHADFLLLFHWAIIASCIGLLPVVAPISLWAAICVFAGGVYNWLSAKERSLHLLTEWLDRESREEAVLMTSREIGQPLQEEPKSLINGWDTNCHYYSSNTYLHCAISPMGGCDSCLHRIS
jgi:hypothetical protein